MKKGVIILIILFINTEINAQHNFDNQNIVYSLSGSIGIGTANPFSGTGNAGLHIDKGVHSSILLGNPISGFGGIVQTSDQRQRVFIGANLYDDQNGSWSSFQPGKGSAGISILADENDWGTKIEFLTSQSDGRYNRSVSILGNGNVGIGTTNPFSGTGNVGLHIDRGAHSSILLGNPISGFGGIVQTSDQRQRVFIGANLYNDQNGSWSSFQPGKGSAGISILADENDWGTKIEFLTSQSDGRYNRSVSILGNGNVGIGTTNPGTYKLAVNGNIRAKEIKVETGWADYVFSEDYDLPTLKEVEQHIKQKGHLINIPSAKDVEKNGIQLGEMNRLLLEKIEELTLYIIQLKKENRRILELENRLKNLEDFIENKEP